jgi:hypothetical protein
VTISTHLVDASSLPNWRKSSHSGPTAGECVEVAEGVPGLVPVRDSKDPQGPALLFPAEAWIGFIGEVKAGRFGA